MKKFMVLYHSTKSAQEQMAGSDPEMMKKGMEMWMSWAQRAGAALVDMGSPLQCVAHLSGQHGGHIGGYSVLQADSTDGVKKLMDGHPHLMMPGNSIEILEYMPIPGM